MDKTTILILILFIAIPLIVITLGIQCMMDDEKNDDNDERNNKEPFCRNSNNNSLSYSNTNKYNCIMGNVHREEYSRQNMGCYEEGKITNICTIVALDNIKRTMKNILSETEKDAIDNAIKNTISIEKLNNYINDENNIDIEDYI